MKAFISFFLIFSHLFSTVGFSIGVHECGGEKSYAFFGISFNSSCQCDHESEDHDKDCCQDKNTTFKAKYQDKQISKVNVVKKELVEFEVNSPSEFISKEIITYHPNSFAFGTKHPPDYSPSLYILHNVFLI